MAKIRRVYLAENQLSIHRIHLLICRHNICKFIWQTLLASKMLRSKLRLCLSRFLRIWLESIFGTPNGGIRYVTRDHMKVPRYLMKR